MILVMDNYDSFTFNLVRYLQQLDKELLIRRNNEITTDEIEQINPSHILISPGPGNPDTAGICLDVVHHFFDKIPILGVCLGHQVIAQAFGGSIVKAKKPMHGKVSTIHHDKKGIFHSLKNPLNVTRYHSLIVNPATLPATLEISAATDQGEIMALRHKTYKIEGIQAHPEAILTEDGLKLLRNFFVERNEIK